MRNLLLNGIMPPLTTPFDRDGNIDLQGLAQNIERYNETGLAGYVALGSNGEAAHLDTGERARVIETVRRAATPGLRVIAGVNELSTRAAIDSARRAAEAGADALLVITPYFYKSQMTQSALATHFTAVADSSSIPLLIYNFPQNTGVTIYPETIARLAEHTNIIGVKDSSGDLSAVAEIIRRADDGFQTLTGSGSILYPSILMNAAGAILAVACAAPRACVELYEAAKRGDHARARELQNRVAPVSQTLTAEFGVAGLKAAMDMLGYKGGEPRAPLAPVSDSVRVRIKEVLSQSGLFPELE